MKLKKSDGDKGIFETVKIISKLADQYKTNKNIRILALDIVKNVKNGSELDQATAIYNYIKGFNYVNDVHGVETISTPILTIKTRSGDCDDLSLLSASLLLSIGIGIKYVITSYSKDKQFSHIYLFCYPNGKRTSFDATAKKNIGYERPYFTRRNILKIGN